MLAQDVLEYHSCEIANDEGKRKVEYYYFQQKKPIYIIIIIKPCVAGHNIQSSCSQRKERVKPAMADPELAQMTKIHGQRVGGDDRCDESIGGMCLT